MIRDKKYFDHKSLGWFIGEINTDCDVTCEAYSLVCTEDEMWNHNSDVDTPERLANLINKLQGNTSFYSCIGSFGNTPDVPVFSTSEGFCLNSSPSRPKHKVDCGRLPTPEGQLKRRLCYCHAGKSKYTKKVIIVQDKISFWGIIIYSIEKLSYFVFSIKT